MPPCKPRGPHAHRDRQRGRGGLCGTPSRASVWAMQMPGQHVLTGTKLRINHAEKVAEKARSRDQKTKR